MTSPVLYEDIFEVLVVNPEGKRFDKGPCPLNILFSCIDLHSLILAL